MIKLVMKSKKEIELKNAKCVFVFCELNKKKSSAFMQEVKGIDGSVMLEKKYQVDMKKVKGINIKDIKSVVEEEKGKAIKYSSLPRYRVMREVGCVLMLDFGKIN